MPLPSKTNIPRVLTPHYIEGEGSTLFGNVVNNFPVDTGEITSQTTLTLLWGGSNKGKGAGNVRE